MPVNQYGNEDLSAFFHGAQVGNMLVQQRERAQELASENALRAVQERHLAAQADQISYALQQKKEQDVKDEIDLQTGSVLHAQLVQSGLPADQANATVNDWFSKRNPDLARKVANAQSLAAKPELTQEAIQTRAANTQSRNQTALAIQQMKIAAEQDPNGVKRQALDISRQRNNLRQQYIDHLKTRENFNPQDREEMRSIYKDIDAYREQLRGLPDTVGLIHPSPNPKKALIEAKIEGAKGQLKALKGAAGIQESPDTEGLDTADTEQFLGPSSHEEAPPGAPTQAPSSSVDNPDEEVPVLSPNGKKGTVPRRNIEKAHKMGYKIL